jgi:hypothetical protein
MGHRRSDIFYETLILSNLQIHRKDSYIHFSKFFKSINAIIVYVVKA